MDNKEAIANLNHIYGMVAPDIQRSIDVAIKALERPQGEWEKDNIGIYCSICKRHLDIETPFCSLCGADMRKGGAE